MKKRIFALLLCVVMLASMIPLMGASVFDNGGTGTVTVSPAAAAVSEDRKAVITAVGGDGAYQWQIYAGNDVGRISPGRPARSSQSATAWYAALWTAARRALPRHKRRK